ncbi:hypothetical protein C4D60_Mb06t03400 [Musa balbisiana]|uniref:Uncharacterized protein n=1 Tax=Musa balbisiana TaxID=52838 RepID=A0A4S8IK89_MUSBA|nr:hypothetical protein C4D60_Mb06t03400 [Musa balbisiana]
MIHNDDLRGEVGSLLCWVFLGIRGNETTLQDSSLNTAYRHSSNSSNLVHVLQGETKGLVRGSLGLLDQVKGFQ